MNEKPTVFIHAGWRCASTYVWSRLRVLAHTTCFYEPFGERLAHVSTKRIERDTAQGWDSHHPRLERPYRYEYRPLLRPLLRGVSGYRESFAIERYFPREGVRREISYLKRLIGYAHRRDTLPVLGFSRSLARAPALKAALGGYHIVLRRTAPRQWLSCRSFRAGAAASYFELCHALILVQAPADSPARHLASTLGLPRLPRLPRVRTVRSAVRELQASLGSWSDTRSYQVFIAVYLLSQSAGEPAADLLLDVDRLGTSDPYRRDVTERLREATALAVDFSDARSPLQPNTDVAVDFEAVEDDIRRRLLACGVDLGAPAVIQ